VCISCVELSLLLAMPPARVLQGLSILAPVQPQPAHLLLQAPAVCPLLYGLLGPCLMAMAWTRTWRTYITVQNGVQYRTVLEAKCHSWENP
jgi:hypothetical protein